MTILAGLIDKGDDYTMVGLTVDSERVNWKEFQ